MYIYIYRYTYAHNIRVGEVRGERAKLLLCASVCPCVLPPATCLPAWTPGRLDAWTLTHSGRSREAEKQPDSRAPRSACWMEW